MTSSAVRRGMLASRTAPLLRTGTRSTSTVSDRAERRRRRQLYDRILRVNHAGEFGADRIYAGQLAVLGSKSEAGAQVRHMWEQEKEHLKAFEELLSRNRARPTALLPLWNVAGFALGAATALLGKRSAMACTVAVESVITEHYTSQIRELLADQGDTQRHKELLDVISKCRNDEQEHHDVGLANEAAEAPFYQLMTSVIGAGCRTAIWVAERI
uniref:5-demethoxyubiquinone hydroxylase, mitochondrial n=1 Tax=Ixodes ricinus TaxID=34613 RepID=A0A6B0V3F2_IXORI